MNKSILYFAICLTAFVTSCGEELDDKYEYLAIIPELSVSESSLSASGDKQTLSIEINCNSFWTATSNSNWIHMDSNGGKGRGSLYLKVDANPSATAERQDYVSVSDGINTIKIIVTQAPVPAAITVSKSNLDFTYKGGSSSVSIESNVEWTASSDASWCTLSKTTSGITVNVQSNNSYSSRSANITIKYSSLSITIKVSQSAPKEPTVDALTVSGITKTTANCQFSYSSSDLKVQKRGVCYSSSNNLPTTSDKSSETSVSAYSGTASYTLSGLTLNTTYYVRPYVETSVGITYGNTVQFTTAKIISPDEGDNPTPNY